MGGIMPSVTYVESNGTEHVVDLASGMSVMEGARNAGVPGIDADCGGACSCATCHVHVAPEWLDRLSGPEMLETEMLDCADGLDEYSRLSCQIKMTEALNGLVVHVPEDQRAG